MTMKWIKSVNTQHPALFRNVTVRVNRVDFGLLRSNFLKPRHSQALKSSSYAPSRLPSPPYLKVRYNGWGQFSVNSEVSISLPFRIGPNFSKHNVAIWARSQIPVFGLTGRAPALWNYPAPPYSRSIITIRQKESAWRVLPTFEY